GRLPVDVLKIDRSIIRKVPHNRQDTAVASAVINLAQELNMQVVGEGIETLEQLAFLERRGCTGGQGLIFSPPIPALEMTSLLSSRQQVMTHSGLLGLLLTLPDPPPVSGFGIAFSGLSSNSITKHSLFS